MPPSCPRPRCGPVCASRWPRCQSRLAGTASHRQRMRQKCRPSPRRRRLLRAQMATFAWPPSGSARAAGGTPTRRRQRQRRRRRRQAAVASKRSAVLRPPSPPECASPLWRPGAPRRQTRPPSWPSPWQALWALWAVAAARQRRPRLVRPPCHGPPNQRKPSSSWAADPRTPGASSRRSSARACRPRRTAARRAAGSAHPRRPVSWARRRHPRRGRNRVFLRRERLPSEAKSPVSSAWQNHLPPARSLGYPPQACPAPSAARGSWARA
mmetsp:Transcript_55189/g.153805  ORF Transcript_55189/g.153805 Transcript_55189/m.153805 type:complete len:268 (-) Transcript_55189:305-1108(-)